MIINSHWKWFQNYDISGYTLLIPSVAVGNVGQLACDLLISSLRMEKIASVYSPAQIPVVGCDPYDLNSCKLSNSCELYIAPHQNVLVLQMRAPLIVKFARQFLDNLLEQFREKHIRDVFIITSSFAHEKKHIMTSPFRYIATETTPYKEIIQDIKLIPHEQQETDLKIFGGGFAAMLFKLSQEKSIPCFVLYKFCSEGDNIPDAYDMINRLQEILVIFNKEKEILEQVIQPASWKLLFGRPPPQDIY